MQTKKERKEQKRTERLNFCLPFNLAKPSAAYEALSSLQQPTHVNFLLFSIWKTNSKLKSPGTPNTCVTPIKL
jgi:hypothetical protein